MAKAAVGWVVAPGAEIRLGFGRDLGLLIARQLHKGCVAKLREIKCLRLAQACHAILCRSFVKPPFLVRAVDNFPGRPGSGSGDAPFLCGW